MTAGPGTGEGRIVVGVDGSRHSKQPLRWSAHFAGIFGARLEAVTAWEFPPSYGWAAVPPEWNPGQDMEKVLDDTVRAVFGDQPPVGVQRQVHEGGAAKILLDASEGAVMLVVRIPGPGGLARPLLWSVSPTLA